MTLHDALKGAHAELAKAAGTTITIDSFVVPCVRATPDAASEMMAGTELQTWELEVTISKSDLATAPEARELVVFAGTTYRIAEPAVDATHKWKLRLTSLLE